MSSSQEDKPVQRSWRDKKLGVLEKLKTSMAENNKGNKQV